MLFQKCLVGLLALASLAGTGLAQAGLSFATRGDSLAIWGKAEKGDADKLKERLTLEIKTVVLRGPTGDNWSLAKELSDLIEKASVTTVVHGSCTSYTCAMIFLAGQKRMFSGAGRPETHYVSIQFHESNFVTSEDKTSISQVVAWWKNHTKLSSSDLRPYHESIFFTPRDSPNDRRIFFPGSAKFSKGNALLCAGEKQTPGKQQFLVDCMNVPETSALTAGVVTTNDLFTHPDLTERADIQVPTPSNASAQVKISDNCHSMYQEFIRQDSPKAFVVTSNWGCNWVNAQSFRPYETALNNCQKTVGVECRFYAIDDKVVFTPFDQPLPIVTAVSEPVTTQLSTLVLDAQNTALLLARNASKEDGPSGVNDKFTVEGKIVAYLTLKWDEASIKGGKQSLEVRWFNGDKLVSTQKQELDLSTSPQRTWLSTLAADIGIGKARVEVYSKDKLIGSKSFSIVEKM